MTRISFSFCVALASLAAACKPRTNDASVKDDGAPAVATAGTLDATPSGLKDFALEPTGQFARKLGARLAAADVPSAGCAHAARYVVTASPGRKKTSWRQFRGDLVDSLQAVAGSQLYSWDNLEQWVTLPTYGFMACKGLVNYPGLDEAPKELLGTLKAKARALKAGGLRPVFVIATAEDAEVSADLLGSVKAELVKSAADIGLREIKLKSRAGLEQATTDAAGAFATDSTASDAYIVWAYGMAGPIVLNAMAGDLPLAVRLRNQTALLMTVGAPIGGALPALVADTQVRQAFDRAASRLNLIGVKTVEDAAYRNLMRPADWLSPASRAAYLANFKNLGFALTRNDAFKAALGDKLEIAHVAAVQDPGNLRFLPRLMPSGGTVYGVGDLANQLLLPVYQKFPLSDGMVALEHAVIPPAAVPPELDVRLTAVLRMGHFDLAMTTPDTSVQTGRDLTKIGELPSFALVDALFASAWHAIDTKEVPEKEPVFDPAAERKKAEADFAAARGVLIRSKQDNYCLDVPDPNGELVYAHPCHGGTNQRWFLDRVNGQVSFRSAANPQKCVDTHTGDKQKKVGLVRMFPCHLKFNQTYTFGRQPNPVEPVLGMGFNEIHTALYGNLRCLDIDISVPKAPNGNKLARRVYFFTQCHGGDNQQWMVDAAMPN